MPTHSDPKIDGGDIPADILIVDDETPNLHLLSELLGREGYHVRPANNPQLALDSALGQPPKMILLDVRMPEMDGFEVCRRLKQDERTRDIPILFVSALQDVEDKVRGFEAGGVDYITKPFQEAEVLARVDTHLTIHRLRQEVRTQRDQLEHELETVSKLQLRLLPKTLPEIAGLDLAAYYATSRYAGGDYYDFRKLPDGRIGILVADAEGHSSPATVLMAMTCALFYSCDGDLGDPEQVLDYLNRHLCGLAEPSFVTALYAVYDPRHRSLRAGRAGHGYPVIYEAASKQAREWNLPGVFPLGIRAFSAVPVVEIQLHPQDRCLLYTDGITERFSHKGECFGDARLMAGIEKTAGLDARKAVEAIMRDVEEFAGARAADDDQALILGVVV
ncbi:MAG: SpoIIE family protein phosphatase [Desulfobacterales bacterium]|jgi:sigma-B regulation protein RsbU (phosphoserine phosphatase)